MAVSTVRLCIGISRAALGLPNAALAVLLQRSTRTMQELMQDYTDTQQKCKEEKQVMNEALLGLTLDLTEHRECVRPSCSLHSGVPTLS